MTSNEDGISPHTFESIVAQQLETVDGMEKIDTIEEMFAKRALPPASPQREAEEKELVVTDSSDNPEIVASD